MNELYETLDRYTNFFIPSMKLLKKERIGSKYKRVYEKNAKTAYQRALEHTDVTKSVKKSLQKQYESLDPLELKEKVDMLYKAIITNQKRYGKAQKS